MTIMMDDDDQDSLPEVSTCKEFYASYEVKEVLGKGISSTVRKCIQKDTKVEYAVKIIDLTGESEDEGQQEEFRKQTIREVEILKMCADHKHIIELHETFETPTFMFLIFEICKKGELFDYLTQVVTFSEKRTRQIMRQLLEAVVFIHSKSIVHRDLKPENILLDDQMNVKLSDFGFAIIVKDDYEIQDLCGTPGYLAPEVLKVSMYEEIPGYGKPCDMWACGVIMYTLLVGCPPFWHRKQMYMLRSIMQGQYSFHSPEWDDISEPPKDLIAKLLVVEPENRLTATQALEHPFFKREEVVSAPAPKSTHVTVPSKKPEREVIVKKFFPKRTFKAAVHTVIATIRIKFLHLNPPPIHIDVAKKDPYSSKVFRRIIDSGAFKIYGHWVKRGENQNRAALFENFVKRDLKQQMEQESEEDLTAS